MTRAKTAQILLLLMFATSAIACTNLLVTPGASADGSAFVTYTCDGVFHPHLRQSVGADHEPGSMQTVTHWNGEVHAEIPWPARSNTVTSLINEHQVVVAETTFDGRLELHNANDGLHYWGLMNLILQRASTAREAVDTLTHLIETYGYRSTGESFSICDPHEVWIVEMIGAGAEVKGAVWVARKLPDGTISAHANMARIGVFPKDDPKNTMYSDNIFDVAETNGWWSPKDGPLNFREVYDPATVQKKRYCATRVWSLFRRAAPSQEFDPAFHRGDPDAERYPLWIKPDEKITLSDVMSLMRDHYEGTDYDMTVGIDAGPFGCPNRWRPMAWEQEGDEYSWERPISTQQTGFSFIGQCRASMPDPVGGCLWYGVDDTATTVWFPLYAGVTDLPPSYTIGSLGEFSWDSAWWIFNLVANYASLKYDYMIEDIRLVQSEIEGNFIAMQPAIESTAIQLHKQDPALAAEFLTTYSVSAGERVTARWQDLAKTLLTTYNDGYVRDNGQTTEVGYPEDWHRHVLQIRPEQFRLQQAEGDTTTNVLPY